MEKLAKSVEFLKSGLNDDQLGKRQEKILHLNVLADSICILPENQIGDYDFSAVLSTVMEVLLCYCSDSESDVRSSAEENLDKIIRAKLHSVYKIQVNFFKELKRNGNARSLKLALIKMADLIKHLPIQRLKLLQTNLTPQIVRISSRTEESLLETLPGFIEKTYEALGPSMSDSNFKQLVAAFYANLSSTSSVSRRTAALCISTLCKYCPNSTQSIIWVLQLVLRKILPLEEATNVELLIGSLLALRSILSTSEKLVKDENFVNRTFLSLMELCFEVFINLCTHSSSIVVTAALEGLLQLLKVCPLALKEILTEESGISKRLVDEKPTSVFLGEDNETVYEDSLLESGVNTLEEYSALEAGVPNAAAAKAARDEIASESDYYSQTTMSISSRASSFDDIPDKIKSLKVDDAGDGTESIAGNLETDFGRQDTVDHSNIGKRLNIGSYILPEQTPIVFALRLIASEFLLKGTKGEIWSDSDVRVSQKSLAFQNIAMICEIGEMRDLHLPLELCVTISPTDQLIEDISLFADHKDPQVRSGLIMVYGSLLKSILKCESSENRMYSKCLDILLSSLTETEAPVIRAALNVLTCTIDIILQNRGDSDIILDIIESVLFLRNHKYWLVKISAFEFFQCIDFALLYHHEKKSGHHAALSSLQDQILSFIIEHLSSSSVNVREAASETILSLIPQLFCPGDKTVASSSEVIRISQSYSKIYHESLIAVDQVFPAFLSINACRNFKRTPKSSFENESSVSFIIQKLTCRLESWKDVNYLSGTMLTLSKMSDKFPPSKYPHCWRVSYTSRKEETQSISGLLNLCISLFSTSVVSSNVSLHSDLLRLATALLTAEALRNLEKPDIFDDTTKNHRDWPVIRNDALASLFSVFLQHLLRLLSMYEHVLRHKKPVVSPVKNSPKLPANLPSLPAYFPAAPTLPSPIKKKGQKLVETAVSKAKSTSINLPSIPTKILEDKFSKPSTPLPVSFVVSSNFTEDTNLMSLFEMLENMNKAFKFGTSQGDRENKFTCLISEVLYSLGEIFQFASVKEINLYTASMLPQIDGCMKVVPVSVVQCVQKLFHSLFGSSSCHVTGDNEALSPRKHTLSDGRLHSIYSSTFAEDYSAFTQNLAHDESSVSSPYKPPDWQSKNRLSLVNQHIRSFEALVMQSLYKYNMCSRADEHVATIDLLCQLINLRVNYSLLDNELKFLDFVYKQVDALVEFDTNSPMVEELLTSILVFLLHLSYQKLPDPSQTAQTVRLITSLEKVTNYASRVHQHSVLSALNPLVHDLYVVRGILKRDNEEELSGKSRDMVFNMIMGISENSASWDLLTVILKCYHKQGEAPHKSISEKVHEKFLLSFENYEILLTSQHDIEKLENLFAWLHPASFHSMESYLKLFFSLPLKATDINASKYLVLVCHVLRILCKFSDEEQMLGKIKDCKPKIISDLSPVFKSSKPEDAFGNQLLFIISMIAELPQSKLENRIVTVAVFKILKFLQYFIKSSFSKRISESLTKIISGNVQCVALKGNMLLLTEQLRKCLVSYPFLLLQWCDILVATGYSTDSNWWPSLLYTGQSACLSPHDKLIKDACVCLLADSAMSTTNEEETASWLIINHVPDLCRLTNEPPVKDLFAHIYKSPALSGLFAQSLFKEDSIASFTSENLSSLLQILKSLNSAASEKVFLFIMSQDALINSPLLGLQKASVFVASNKLSQLSENYSTSMQPLTPENMTAIRQKILVLNLHFRYPEFVEQLLVYSEKVSPDQNFVKQLNATASCPDIQSFTSFDFNLVATILKKTKNLSPDVFAVFVLKMDETEIDTFLSDYHLPLDVIRSLLLETQNDPWNFLTETCFNQFISYSTALVCETANISGVSGKDPLLSQKSFNRKVNLYFDLLKMLAHRNKNWVIELKQFGLQLLVLVQKCLDKFLSDSNTFADVNVLISSIPYVAILAEDNSSFNEHCALCKLLLLLVRNTLVECFPPVKSVAPDTDDRVVTVRECMMTIKLLSVQTHPLGLLIKDALASLCRHSAVIEFCRVPEEIWKADYEGNAKVGVKLENIDASLLIEPEIFVDFQARVEALGWISKQSFEEIWMTYLAVLNFSSDEEYVDPEEKWKIRRFSFNAIVNLVAMAMRCVIPGNSTISGAPAKNARNSSSMRRPSATIQYQTVAHVKKTLAQNQGVVKSASIHFADCLPQGSLVPASSADSDVDLNSCVVLLNEQCHHWLDDQTMPTCLVCDVFKGLILLSNLYSDTNQFEWLYLVISEMHRRLPPEDELTPLYTLPLLCQCINATPHIHPEEVDHLVSILNSGLNSSMLSIETTTLCGFSLLMKCAEKNRVILKPFVSNQLQDYIIKRLTSATSLASASPSEHYMLSLVSVALDLFSNFIDDLRDTEFAATVIQMLLMFSGHCTKNVFCAIFTRLDELIITQALNRKVVDLILKTTLHFIKASSHSDALYCSVNVFLSCLYSYYPPAINNVETGPEALVDTVERITVLMDRFQVSTPQQAKVLVEPLARLMIDYFPLHDRFYKVLGLYQKTNTNNDYNLLLMFLTFKELLQCDSQKVLLELMLPPFPNIVEQRLPTQSYWAVSSFLLCGLDSPFAESFIKLLASVRQDVMMSTSRHVILPNYKLTFLEGLSRTVIRVFYSLLDCELDRVQFKDNLIASNVKSFRELASTFQ